MNKWKLIWIHEMFLVLKHNIVRRPQVFYGICWSCTNMYWSHGQTAQGQWQRGQLSKPSQAMTVSISNGTETFSLTEKNPIITN